MKKYTELELCKLFAELEGFEVIITTVKYPSVTAFNSKKTKFDYNPITDLALNCAARDKYEVSISYEDEAVEIRGDDCYVMFGNKTDIPRAVIECILKSEGKL